MKNKSCLVIVDMINGFVKEGALSDVSIQKIVPGIVELTKKYQVENKAILSFQDAHSEDAKEFLSFPKHCLKGTAESELIQELKPYQDKMIQLYKNSTNGFMQDEFLDVFHKLDCDEFVVVGCCTDICVLQFSLSLQGYINEQDLNKKIIVVEDLVETFNAPGHAQQEYNKMAVSLLKGAGITVKNSKEILYEG